METEQILTAARSWLGTKFHHQGRKKGVGVDCIGLIVGVAAELGLQPPDRLDYARQPDESDLQIALATNLQRGRLQVGSVALFSIDGRAQHVGIITDYQGLGVIHAYIQARKVVEHVLDDEWKKRIISTFSFY
jgi:cell wall-associated NlpC family hydrolase